MPYVDRQNRVCGFLDIEEKEGSSRFQRRYFILDTQGNTLQWYMDNPQNLPSGANAVGILQLTYISKVSEATGKQKSKTEFCFVINAVSRRYFLHANDAADLKDWVLALNKATKITVPKAGPLQPRSEVSTVTGEAGGKRLAYKTEIIGGVVVHTPIYQNEGEEMEVGDRRVSSVGSRPGVLRCGYCVKQGNVRKSWKRRFFTLDHNAVSYYKCEMDKEPLRAVPLRDIQKVHECLVKSGDLLMRDNLFEIITSSRVFYVQTDTPEDMQGWIRDIELKIQDFRGPAKGSVFTFASSLYRHGNSSHPPSVFRGRQGDDRRPPLVKSCSVAPGWQPWTPVPQREAPALGTLDKDSPFSNLPSSLSSRSTSSSTSSSSSSPSTPTLIPQGVPAPALASGVGVPACPGPIAPDPSSSRRRHRSQPQPPKDRSFPFSLDDDGIRTTDV
ncbi:pleckstrin homology domain-containing family A member 2 isoform X2 [Salmo salar]|uniref:Pleckstrin homology domain-containing family A member 2 isoform X2 n=1 Tax=Salmo salar TaxID=8030 RepID=A0A1S3PF17_SALSA|nr:pleckstrin homology domain-containing family A member 2 isoform X2 [Salmo salar]|eukprot:XP_014026206.1 PREDICTED: pleckstrin homology domain-containing family A member 2-like isoform X2 [Salmo salar]